MAKERSEGATTEGPSVTSTVERASAVQFDDCGHVPPLVVRDQIDIVTKFLKWD